MMMPSYWFRFLRVWVSGNTFENSKSIEYLYFPFFFRIVMFRSSFEIRYGPIFAKTSSRASTRF